MPIILKFIVTAYLIPHFGPKYPVASLGCLIHLVIIFKMELQIYSSKPTPVAAHVATKVNFILLIVQAKKL